MPFSPSDGAHNSRVTSKAGTGEVTVLEATSLFEDVDAVALLGKSERGDAAAETRADDQPTEAIAGVCGRHVGACLISVRTSAPRC